MNRDKLYDAAFRYKKAKIWNKLWDTEVYALRLKSGEIGYISIMGKGGDYNALGLYIGEEGFRSFRKTVEMRGDTGSEFRNHEMMLQQKCLHAELSNKDELLPDEIEEVRAYAKKNDIKISGKNAYPQFIKFEPYRQPWAVKTEEDISALCEALDSAVLLAGLLKNASPEDVGIFPIGADTEEVQLFEVKQNQLLPAGIAPLPFYAPDRYEYLAAENQIDVAAARRLPKKDIWEAELVCMLNPVGENPEEAPYYPFYLLTVDSESEFLLPASIIGCYETDLPEMLHEYAEAWKTLGFYPRELRCRDERTYAFLKDFSEKTGARISVYKGTMAALDDAEASLYDYMFGGDEEENNEDLPSVEEIAGMILSLDKSELRQMPEPLLQSVKIMLSESMFPEELAEKLKKKLKGL